MQGWQAPQPGSLCPPLQPGGLTSRYLFYAILIQVVVASVWEWVEVQHGPQPGPACSQVSGCTMDPGSQAGCPYALEEQVQKSDLGCNCSQVRGCMMQLRQAT
jgi:hypothetical protein